MRIFLLLFFLSLAFSCNNGKSIENDRDLGTRDESGHPDEDIETEDDLSEKDDADNWWEAPVVKCDRDSDCPDPEKEFCDPYGECQCRQAKGFVIRYKGKCIHGSEGQEKFCNGRSRAFNLRHEVPRKGRIAYTEKIEDVTCLCDSGYYGLNCERANEDHPDYPDRFFEGTTETFFLPEPDCEKDEDCSEGMKCSEKGYCYCDGEVNFHDPAILEVLYYILGKTDFDGEDLLDIKMLNLRYVHRFDRMECLPNLRALTIEYPIGEIENFDQLAYLKNLQHLAVLQGKEEIDFSPVAKLERLMSLTLQVYSSNYQFLHDMEPDNHVQWLRLMFEDEGPSDFDFFTNFKKLNALIVHNFESPGNCSFDISSITGNRDLFFLTLYPGLCGIKNLNKLAEFKELNKLHIGNYSSLGLKKIKLSDFPVLPNIVELFIDRTTFDSKMKDHFPSLTDLIIYGDQSGVKDLDFLEGLNNLLQFNFSEDQDEPVFFDENRYTALSEQSNLMRLSIGPYKSRNYEWIEGLKHATEISFITTTSAYSDSKWDDAYRDYYIEHGATNSSYLSNLLYLTAYIDRTYHLDELSGIRAFSEKINNPGRSKLQENYLNSGNVHDIINPGIILCSNPVDIEKNINDLELIRKNGVTVAIGETRDKCDEFPAKNLLLNNENTKNQNNKIYFFNDKRSLKWIGIE